MRSVDFLKHLAVLSVITVGFTSDFINAGDGQTCDHGSRLCYIYTDPIQEQNWTEASNLCKKKNATLLVILNNLEQMHLKGFLSTIFGSNIEEVWTAGKQHVNDKFTWLNGRQENAVIQRDEYTHVKVNRSLHFIAANPSHPVYSFCQFSGDGCPSGPSSLFKLANGCLYMNDDKDLTWYQARKRCLGEGGDLAVFENKDMNILRNWIKKRQRNDFWIGLRKSSFRWFADGTAGLEDEIKYSNFTNKTQFSISNDCISISSSDGEWIVARCENMKKVVCQQRMGAIQTKSETSTLPFEPTPTSSFDPVLIVGVVVGAVVIIVCIIIIIVVVMKRSGKSSRREDTPKCGTETEHSGRTTKGLRPVTENRQPATTDDQCQYAEVSTTTTPFENREASAINGRPDIVYATMDFQNDSGYEKIGNMPVIPNVAQQGDQALYAEPFAQ